MPPFNQWTLIGFGQSSQFLYFLLQFFLYFMLSMSLELSTDSFLQNCSNFEFSDQSNKIAVLKRPNRDENQNVKQPPKFERNYEKIQNYGLVKTKTRQNFLSSQPEAEYIFVWTEKLRKLFVVQLLVRMLLEITFLVFFFLIQAEQHNEKLTVSNRRLIFS